MWVKSTRATLEEAWWMNKSLLSIVLIALMVSSSVLFGTGSNNGHLYAFGAIPLAAPNVSASPGTVDQGQTSSLTSTAVTSGTSPYTYQWFARAPSGTYAKVGTSSASYSFVTTSSTTTGSWSFILQVTDSTSAAVNTTATSVTVDPALVAPTVTAAPVTVNQGQTSALTFSTVTAGSGGYTYQWFAKASGAGSYSLISGATSLSYSFSTTASTAAGSWGFLLQVNDSTSASVNTTAASVTVNSALVAPRVTPTPAVVDQGQTSVLTSAAVSSGTSPYTYQWLEKAPGGAYVDVGSNSASFHFNTTGSTATGDWNFELQVTDSASPTVTVTSSPVNVTVDSALVAPTVTAAHVKIDEGQTSVLSSSAVTTGSGGYKYQWFAKAPRGSYATVGTNAASYNFVTSVSNATGGWGFILQVTDSTGLAVNSTAVIVTVNARAALPFWVIYVLIAIVAITVLLIIILFAWRRRTRKMSTKKDQPADDAAKKKQPVNVGVEVSKVEIADSKVKFFVAKGRRKKHWVSVKEIPILEIEHIESSDNQLTVTWKGVADSFYTKDKIVSFTALVEQVNGILEEQRANQLKTAEANEKNTQRKNELQAVIEKSIHIVDSSFDVLIGLQDKRISWPQVEAFANELSTNLNFTGQTLPPLVLDYSKIVSAVKAQVPRDASKEAFDILKALNGYFDALKPEEDAKENPLNFQTTKTLISVYFMLNDLLLARFVGDKTNSREIGELEAALQSLAEVNFKVDVEALKGSISVEGEKQVAIDDSRAIFKDQLKKLSELAFIVKEVPVQASETQPLEEAPSEDLQPLTSEPSDIRKDN